MTMMKRKQTAGIAEGLETTDLLPRQFRDQRRGQRTLYAWSALTLSSLAILFGTVTAFWARAKQIESQETQLIADAAPLVQVRDDVIRMLGEIETLQRSCALVESVKPSDELLQALAVITSATQNAEQEVLIDSVDVRLSLETADSKDPQPEWARPELVIIGTFADQEATTKWIERVNASDRIRGAALQQPAGALLSSRTTITATPLATRQLP